MDAFLGLVAGMKQYVYGRAETQCRHLHLFSAPNILVFELKPEVVVSEQEAICRT